MTFLDCANTAMLFCIAVTLGFIFGCLKRITNGINIHSSVYTQDGEIREVVTTAEFPEKEGEIS